MFSPPTRIASATLRSLLGHVAQLDAHLDLGRAAHPPHARHDLHVLDVDRVDLAHVDLAQEPAEVPPAAGAEAVEGGGAPVGQVGLLRSEDTFTTSVLRPCCQPVEVDLEGEVAGVGADRLAVQPDPGAVVRRPRSGPSRTCSPFGRRGRVNSLRYQPTDDLLSVVSWAFQLWGTPIAVQPTRSSCSYQRSASPWTRSVVLAEVPGAAQQQAPGLALVDERLAARALHRSSGAGAAAARAAAGRSADPARRPGRGPRWAAASSSEEYDEESGHEGRRQRRVAADPAGTPGTPLGCGIPHGVLATVQSRDRSPRPAQLRSKPSVRRPRQHAAPFESAP